MSLQCKGRTLRPGEVIISGGIQPTVDAGMLYIYVNRAIYFIARFRFGSFFVSFVTPLFDVSTVDGALVYFCCAVCESRHNSMTSTIVFCV